MGRLGIYYLTDVSRADLALTQIFPFDLNYITDIFHSILPNVKNVGILKQKWYDQETTSAVTLCLSAQNSMCNHVNRTFI